MSNDIEMSELLWYTILFHCFRHPYYKDKKLRYIAISVLSSIILPKNRGLFFKMLFEKLIECTLSFKT